MEGSTVVDLIEAMPDKDSAEIAPAIERLFALEDEIDDMLLGLARVQFVPSGAGHLVVTDTRLILLDGGGQLRVIEYSEVDSIVIGPGAKKVFGGFEQSYLMVYRHQGDMINLILRGEHDWAVRTMTTAQGAHEQYRLKGTSTRSRSVTARAAAATEHSDARGGEESVTLSPDHVRELDLLLTTLSVYAEARGNEDIVRRVEAFITKAMR
jgi:hypothetical protein